MSNQQFVPFSSQLGIAGTSYRLQMGIINEKWACRILKGNDVIDSYIWQDENDVPNANSIVGYVLKTVQLPMINPYQVSKTVQFLRKEAVRNREEKKMVPSVKDGQEAKAKLEKVPEEQLKRMPDMGWVKEDEPKKPAASTPAEKPASAEKPAAPAEKPATVEASTEASSPKPTEPKPAATPASGKKRKLPPIPSATGATAPAHDHAEIKEKLEKAGVFCVNCGAKIIYCPACGQKLVLD